MMKRCIVLLLGSLLTLQLAAEETGKQQLVKLFTEAEQCYVTDDYQQLEACLNQYAVTFHDVIDELDDSIDVYQAYYHKMCGAFYYGIAEEDSCDYYSELCYRRALNTFNERNNVENAMVLHEELAQLYYKMKSYDKAKTQLDSVYDYYDQRFNYMGITEVKPKYYRTLSQLAMCNARLGDFKLALSQIDEAIHDYYKKQKGTDYYEALRKRGKILMLQGDSLGSTHYKKAVDNYQQYVNERYASIAKEMDGMDDLQRGQYWLATHQFLYDCFRLGNRAPEMLYDLTLFSKDYLVRKNAKKVVWKQVRQALGPKDCAIEFVQYFGKNDEKRMACLVLKNKSAKPQFIDLFSTDSLLNLPLTSVHTIGSAIVYPISDVKDTLYNDPRLATTIWNKQLMAAIGDAQKVYFSPDGLLHQVPIEYLMPDTTKLCCRLSSTRILTQKRSAPETKSALLCGGIEYSTPIKPNNRDNDVAAYRFLAPQTTTVTNLSWTRPEVDTIRVLRNTPLDTLLVGAAATDEAFLKLLKRNYDVIHLSTHGYYGDRIGIYNDLKPLLDDHSMSRSGVLFAGSATTLTDRTFDENLFDGVLSAAELAKQDLTQSELIVLSACQTGLGHLTADGIYGIQRGLKQAGANAMILTLWSVNDYSSSHLMRYFYEELGRQTRKNFHQALRKARQRLVQKEETVYYFDEASFTVKRKVLKFDTPKHIDPFIIIDAY